MRLKLKAALALCALALFAPAAARACSCIAQSARPCARAWSAPVVFVGVAAEERKGVKDQEGWGRRAFRFNVEETFRGSAAGSVEVLTGRGGGDCGYNFVVGTRYLVYAHEGKDGALSTGICSATRPAERAREDLEYLRGLSRHAPEASVYGVVLFNSRDLLKGAYLREPVSGAKVVVEGDSARREAATDAEGKFEVSGLPAGRYTVKVSGREHASSLDEPKPFELRPAQCADLYFSMTWGGRVAGRVTDESGGPVRSARLHLAPVGLGAKEFSSHDKTLTAYSDEEGRYEFDGVPPGRYLIVFNPDGLSRIDEPPYPRTFLPGTGEEAEATVVTVGEGERVTGQDVRLTRRRAEREITGTVVWSDGRPAGTNVSAHLYYAAHPHRDVSSSAVDEQGRFTLRGWDGETFVVTATANLEGGKQMCAGPAEVSTRGERIAPLKLVVRTPYGNCLRNYKRPDAKP